MTDVFMVEDIRCERMPRGNKRMSAIPVGYYGIVADINIGGQEYEFADIFKDTAAFEKSKKIFAKVILLAQKRAKEKIAKGAL